MKYPIVLIHGFPFDGSMWVPQVTFLAASGYDVLVPHLPGFGNAKAWPKEQYSIEALAEEIYKVIQSEARGAAIVGGFSMGGYVLLALIRKYPQSMRGVILMDTRADVDSPEAREGRLKSIEEVRTNGLAPLAETMLTRQLSRNAPPELRERMRALMMRQTVEGVIGAQWAMSRRRDQTDLLSTIKVPTLIVVGAEDVITPPSVALGMQSQITGSMVVQIAGAGHLSNQEAPEAVNRALEGFLKTMPAG